MPLDQLHDLPNLIRLRLTADLLEIHQLGNVGMRKDMVASADARQPEAESLDEADHVREGDIVGSSPSEPLQQLSAIHAARLPRPE